MDEEVECDLAVSFLIVSIMNCSDNVLYLDTWHLLFKLLFDDSATPADLTLVNLFLLKIKYKYSQPLSISMFRTAEICI